MRSLKLSLIVLAALVLAVPAAGFAGAADLGLAVSPERVQIGATYDGMRLTATGKVPAGSDVVVRFLGAREEIHMKEKGRALGLLWMNLGSLTLEDVPSVALVAASRDLDELGAVAAPMRLERVAEEIKIAPADKDTATNRSEFLKLRRGEGLYREVPGVVTLAPADASTGDGSQAFTAVIPVPSRLKPGAYTVEVSVLKDGAVVGSESRTVQAELVGAPATLADVAFNHSLVYGILATIVALLSGLAIGLVFQSKGAH